MSDNGKRLSDFKPQSRNANKGKPIGLTQLDKSIRRDGYSAPMVAAADGEIFAGSKRLERSADVFGLDVEPIVVHSRGDRPVIHVRDDIPTADDPRAVRLGVADNAIAHLDYDPDGAVLAALAAQDEAIAEMVRCDDLSAVAVKEAAGFGQADAEPQFDRAEELRVKWDVHSGDLWRIGAHRLLCGDSTKREDVERVMRGEWAGMMVTDPPYGVEYQPNWRDGRVGEFGQHAREGRSLQGDDRIDWTDSLLLFAGDVIYMWHASQFASEVASQISKIEFEIRNQIIWAKQHFAISRGDYHWQHEPCWYAVRKGQSSHWSGDRTQSTLWEIASLNPAGRQEERMPHGTQKPLECMARPIRNHQFAVIYDPFVGSGTTIVACENLHRQCRAIEISLAYVAVCLQRMQDAFGITGELI